jgi:hypothetical protein
MIKVKKPNYSWFWLPLGILFLVFLAFYIAYSSGYYEAKVNRKATITQEKINEFEKDVKDGKEIDIKDYVDNDYVDYSSPVSKLGTKIAAGIDTFMDGGVTDFFNFLGTMFT